MIIQLPNGRIIECSVEQYLFLSDDDIKDLNGLSTSYTKEVGDPFYNKFSNHKAKADPIIVENIEEYEPGLDEIEAFEKMNDPYFHSDDT
jgi:hypothetical protein|tara:strand:- start:3857 stop:4126 length:270 start_codon:yes stop_codon:yes gene_type:complete